MKNSKKLGISIASFGTATLCLVGGTFAWYVVSNTGTAKITGTTSKTSGGLYMGIKPEGVNGQKVLNALPEIYKQYPDARYGNTDVYWVHQSTKVGEEVMANKISEQHLSDVYRAEGYSDQKTPNYIEPATTKSYVEVPAGKNPAIELYKVPDSTAEPQPNGNYDSITKSDKDDYIKFTLGFYAQSANQDIYLNAADTFFVGAADNNAAAEVVKTLRVGFSSAKNNYIYSPSHYDAEPQPTDVGGLLDLDADGVWDYTTDYIEDVKSTVFETVVGDDVGSLNETHHNTQKIYILKTSNHSEPEEFTYKYYRYNPVTATHEEVDEKMVKDAGKNTRYLKFVNKFYGEFEESTDINAPENSYLVKNSTEAKLPSLGSNDNAFGTTTPVKHVMSDTSIGQLSSLTYTYNTETIHPKTQIARGLDYFVYHTDAQKNHPLATTDSNGYAEITITIWTEGWEKTSGLKEARAAFSGSFGFHAPGIGHK